jgi:hypothetical protein
MSATAIDEIEDRLHDLTQALHEAGAGDLARPFEELGGAFTDQLNVRRAVHEIAAQLEHWRLDPTGVPDTPKVTLAANRLEDVCREALGRGVIEAAAPSTGAQVRRKVALVLGTLIVAAIALLVPVLLVHYGVDFDDLSHERKLPLTRLPRGEEATVPLALLAEAMDARAVTAVEIGALGDCAQPLPSGATCAKVESRLWPEGRLATFEVKLPHQAYGLLFAFDQLALQGGSLGRGRLWLAATNDTPEGLYELPLEGTYRGYTPQACELMQRVQGACPAPRTGDGEAHRGVELPLVEIEVVPGDPSRRSGEKRLAEALAAEKQAQAAERLKQIESVLAEIEGVLGETEKLVARRKLEEARPRIQKLGALFAPLDDLAQGGVDSVPDALGAARARLDALRDKLDQFEAQIFEKAFAATTDERNRDTSEEKLLSRVASAHRVSLTWVQEIYASRADEIQRRLEARAQKHLESVQAEQRAREQRCGPLPTDAWAQVKKHLEARYAQPRVRVVLGECLTPRLTQAECWELRCQFLRKEEVAVERPPVVTRYEALFFIERGSVVRQKGG